MTFSRLSIALLCTTALANAQSTLPATAPTTLTPTAPVGAITATPVSRATRPAVTFANGLLDVRASNASLHQILRLISRQTGMRITGGVEDQRVFGNYGPAPAGTVLATLLGGTGINIFVREDADHKPLELVMTPRSGGASPPAFQTQPQEDDAPDPPAVQPTVTALSGSSANQAAAAAQTAAATAAAPTTQPNANRPPVAQGNSGPQPIPQPLNNILGSPSNTTPTASTFPTTDSVPLDTLATPSTTTQAAPGIVDSGNPPPAGTQNTGTPAAVTPEQIYQQLLKLQQQKAAPGTPAPTPQ